MKKIKNKTILWMMMGASLLWGSFTLFILSRGPLVFPSNEDQDDRDKVSILLYRWKYDEDDFPGVDDTRDYGVIWTSNDGECPVACEFFDDMKYLSQSDAILFDTSKIGEGFYAYRNPPVLPDKYHHHLWIKYSFHNPLRFPIFNEDIFNSLIDINSTFSLDSDVPLSSFCLSDGIQIEDFYKPQKNENERKGVAFISDNCYDYGSTIQTLYIKELMNYIKIDSFGSCLNNKRSGISLSEISFQSSSIGKLLDIYQKYKFVIVLEEISTKTYITENLLIALLSGAVPIYYGAIDIDQFMPEKKSIINVMDYNNPKVLADEIKRIDADKNIYNQFLKWKKYPPSSSFLSNFKYCIMNAGCRLCQAISEKKKINGL